MTMAKPATTATEARRPLARCAVALAMAAFLAAGLPGTALASPGCEALNGLTGQLAATGEVLLPFGTFSAGDRVSVDFSGPADGKFKFSLIGENEQGQATSSPGSVAVETSKPGGLVYAVDLYLSPNASASLKYQVSCKSAPG